MRILAIDYGQKRVGIAVSDPLGITAQPRPYLPNDGKLFSQLSSLIRDETISEIVIGLPITLQGASSAMTTEVEKFARDLGSQVAVPIVLQDERFSTAESERILIAADVSRKKRKEVRDSMVASMILQDYLERKKYE